MFTINAENYNEMKEKISWLGVTLKRLSEQMWTMRELVQTQDYRFGNATVGRWEEQHKFCLECEAALNDANVRLAELNLQPIEFDVMQVANELNKEQRKWNEL